MKKAWIRKVLFILCLELVRIGIGVPLQQLRPLGAGNVTQVPELPMDNMDEYDLCGACLVSIDDTFMLSHICLVSFAMRNDYFNFIMATSVMVGETHDPYIRLKN